MITYEMIKEAQESIVNHWEEDGKKVIEEIAKANPFNKSFKEFLQFCTACGGNWGEMLLTGIRELWPNVYDAIPDDMGCFAFECIADTLILCGVDTTE